MAYTNSLINPDYYASLEIPSNTKLNNLVSSVRMWNSAYLVHEHTGGLDGHIITCIGDTLNNIFVYGSSKKLGINLMDPTVALHVKNATVAQTAIRLEYGTGTVAHSLSAWDLISSEDGSNRVFGIYDVTLGKYFIKISPVATNVEIPTDLVITKSTSGNGNVTLTTGNLAVTLGTVTVKNAASLVVGSYPLIPAGTKMFFYQATPPDGWTLDTSNQDKMLRIVNSAVNWADTTTLPGSWTISSIQAESAHVHGMQHRHFLGINGGGHTHNGSTAASGTIENVSQVSTTRSVSAASHTHTFTTGTPSDNTTTFTIYNAASAEISNTGSVSHTHSFNGTWRPEYINVIIGTKN